MTNETAATEAAETAKAEPVTLPEDHPLVKTLAAQKAEIASLKEKAARLDGIEEANKSEAQKAAERLASVEKALADAEVRAARRDVALEFGLSKDDAALLDSVSGEDAMRTLASRLSAKASDDLKQGNVARNEGKTPTKPGDDELREFTRNLFGAPE